MVPFWKHAYGLRSKASTFWVTASLPFSVTADVSSSTSFCSVFCKEDLAVSSLMIVSSDYSYYLIYLSCAKYCSIWDVSKIFGSKCYRYYRIWSSIFVLRFNLFSIWGGEFYTSWFSISELKVEELPKVALIFAWTLLMSILSIISLL